jgi:hypothetical protein
METYQLNALELILKDYGARGLSLRRIKMATHFTKRKIMHLIYTSQFIEDTNPWLHGSNKTRINVYNYTPLNKIYKERKAHTRHREQEPETENEVLV